MKKVASEYLYLVMQHYIIDNNKVDINDTEEIERSAIFVFNGALGIINTWVKNDFDTEISILAKSIENICLNGIKKYL